MFTVQEFLNSTEGFRHVRITPDQKPMTSLEFAAKYKETPVWNAKIVRVLLEAEGPTQDRSFSRVVCTIELLDLALAEEYK